MAELTAEQSAALVQRRSSQDLHDLILAFQRDGSVSGEFVDPIEGVEDDEEKAAAVEARDEEIANSQLFSTAPAGPPAVSEAEAASTKEQGEVEAEQNASLASTPPVAVSELENKSAAEGKSKTKAAQGS